MGDGEVKGVSFSFGTRDWVFSVIFFAFGLRVHGWCPRLVGFFLLDRLVSDD